MTFWWFNTYAPRIYFGVFQRVLSSLYCLTLPQHIERMFCNLNLNQRTRIISVDLPKSKLTQLTASKSVWIHKRIETSTATATATVHPLNYYTSFKWLPQFLTNTQVTMTYYNTDPNNLWIPKYTLCEHFFFTVIFRQYWTIAISKWDAFIVGLGGNSMHITIYSHRMFPISSYWPHPDYI